MFGREVYWFHSLVVVDLFQIWPVWLPSTVDFGQDLGDDSYGVSQWKVNTISVHSRLPRSGSAPCHFLGGAKCGVEKERVCIPKSRESIEFKVDWDSYQSSFSKGWICYRSVLGEKSMFCSMDELCSISSCLFAVYCVDPVSLPRTDFRNQMHANHHLEDTTIVWYCLQSTKFGLHPLEDASTFFLVSLPPTWPLLLTQQFPAFYDMLQ